MTMLLLLLDMQIVSIKSLASTFMLCTIIIQIALAANVTETPHQQQPQQQQQHHHQRELTISECAAKGGECDESGGRLVCGTDDQTYPTRCHLLRVQCSGHQVSIKYRGACKVCKEARDYALKRRSKDAGRVFVPRCKTDGTYAPIQCIKNSGCWCSDFTGKPITDMVRIGKPDCRRFYKPNVRRSPMHQHGGTNGGRRFCTLDDQQQFKTNLLSIFQSEYMRQHQIPSAQIQHDGQIEQKILDWKFTTLDVNGNRMLDKQEFRELKKLVRRAVKPKRCGRTFGKMCDINDNEQLSRGEWNACISKSGAPATYEQNAGSSGTQQQQSGYVHHIGGGSSNGGGVGGGGGDGGRKLYTPEAVENESGQQHLDTEEEFDTSDYGPHDDDEEEEEDDGNGDISSARNAAFGGSSTHYPSIYFLRQNPESPLKETEGESDCLTERGAALEAQRVGGTSLYVPECTPDGRRYQRVQCYGSTRYCWCVNEDTGNYIPKTYLKDIRPHCNNDSAPPRAMKGCPEPRKTQFLKNLKEFFKHKIIPSANVDVNATNGKSEDERIAHLSFIALDKNKNMIWERKEWKSFRDSMANSKTLKKCGRKMPRYCDANNDKKITLMEWIDCLQPSVNVENETPSTSGAETVGSTTKPTKLLGSNPLHQYLS